MIRAMSAPDDEQDLSRLLQAADRGEQIDLDRLLPLVYGQLRRMAQHQMANERAGHTLQATALVHEAFLRLADGGRLSWQSKAHFYGAAAEAMRRILLDHARSRGRQKRGGSRRRAAVNLAELVSEAPPEDLLAVDEALSQLGEHGPRAGSVARLRLYAGLSVAEAAEALGIAQRTAERDWTYARTWIHDRVR